MTGYDPCKVARTMSTRPQVHAVVVGGVALVAIPFFVRPADACTRPPPPPIEVPQEVRDVPVEGVLSLFSNSPGATIEVTTLDGELVEGQSEDLGDRVVWRAAAPLAPSTRYRAQIGSQKLEIETAAGPLPTLEQAPEVESVVLREREVPARRVCCIPDAFVDTCRPTGPCWALSYDYVVDLEVALKPISGVDPRNVVETVRAVSGASIQPPAHDRRSAVVTFRERRTIYCAELEAKNLVDGKTVTREVCVDGTGVIPADKSAPQAPDANQCGTPSHLIDQETQMPYPPEVVPVEPVPDDEGLCRAGSGGEGLVVCLAIAAVALVPRRRARRR